MAEANGRESVAKAELEATYESSNKHRYDVSMAKASAAYAIANEKCDDLAGNAQDVCRKEAQSTEIAAKAEAERVRRTLIPTRTHATPPATPTRRQRPRNVTRPTPLPRKSATRSRHLPKPLASRKPRHSTAKS